MTLNQVRTRDLLTADTECGQNLVLFERPKCRFIGLLRGQFTNANEVCWNYHKHARNVELGSKEKLRKGREVNDICVCTLFALWRHIDFYKKRTKAPQVSYFNEENKCFDIWDLQFETNLFLLAEAEGLWNIFDKK